jgi:hypothetical protein
MLKAMDPSMICALIEGQPDVLAEEAKAERELYSRISCPMCHEPGGCEKRLRAPKVLIDEDGQPTVVQSPFSPDRALPQGYAHCVHCGTDFDPYSGLIAKTEATGIAPVDLDPAATIVAPPSDPRRE